MKTLPLFNIIKPGYRVTIVTAHGQTRKGRCVMKFDTHAVLDLGGKHGTPGIATVANTVGVSIPRKYRPTYL